MVVDVPQPRRLRIWITVLVAGLLLAACAANVSSEDLQGVVVDPPQPKPNFTLTDTEGRPYEFAEETEGRLTLLYFGYLNCPDICPVHLAQIAETFDRIPEVARDARVVFVSVDPDRDAPDEIRAFLDNFDDRFVGLTGSDEELAAAQTAAGVPVAVYAGEGDDYTVDHAGWVIAYAPDGMSHSIYPFGVRQSEWNNDLEVLSSIGS
jgi:protein SCO1/2